MRRQAPDDGDLQPLRLRHNVTWVFVGQAVYLASQLGIVFVLSPTPEYVGQFALGLAIAGPVFFLLGLELPVLLSSDAERHYSFNEYLALSLTTAPLSVAIVLGVASIGNFEGAAATVIAGVAISKVVETTGFLLHGLFQQRERMDRVAKSLFLKGPLGLVALTITVEATNSVALGVLALTGVWAVVLIGYDIPTAVRMLRNPERESSSWSLIRPRGSLRRRGRLAWIALPLSAARGTAALGATIPRLLVERSLGTTQLGIFAAIASVNRILDLFSSAVGKSVVPRLARYHVEGKRGAFVGIVARVAAMAAALGALGVLAAALFGESILRLVFGEEYARGEVLTIVVLAGALNVLSKPLTSALIAVRYLRVRFVIIALSVAAIAITALMAVPDHGLVGAAWSLVAGAAVRSGGSAVVVGFAVRRRNTIESGGGEPRRASGS